MSQTAPVRQSSSREEAEVKEVQALVAQAEFFAFKRWHFAAFLVVVGIILGLLGAVCATQYRITYILTHTIKRIHGDTGYLLNDLEL